MVIAAEHYRTNLAITHHFVKLQCDLKSTHSILIENTSLRATDEVNAALASARCTLTDISVA